MIERDIVGGAAHLWDCIPSKAMVATGNELAELALREDDGPRGVGPPRRRRAARPHRAASRRSCASGVTSLLESQGVRLIRGTGRLTGAYTVAADTDDGAERARGRRDPALHRLAAARPRVGDDRRRAHPHHPPGVPAARDPRAPRRDRFGRHRRRVHAHVQRARRAGDADRVAPAGAAVQGPRGRGRARGRVPAPGREAAEGRARDLDRPRGRQGVHRVRRRPRGRRLARAARASARSPTPRASAARRRASRSTTAATSPATATARPTCRTSTPPATCRAGCRCRRSRRCRAARSPST